MLVKEIMTKNLKTAIPKTTLAEVARLMKECDCGAIPVIRSKTDRDPVGIITDRDIVTRAVALGRDISGARVEEYMTSAAISVSPDDSVEECLETMEAAKIRRLVVVDDRGECVGIVTQAQIALNVPGRIAGELLQEISR